MVCEQGREIVVVSGCLLGLRCRYDGSAETADGLLAGLEGVCVAPVCPEQLGGLPTPRPPAEFVGGSGPELIAGVARLVNVEDEDVTEAYLRGADETLKICRLLGVRKAYLKEKSPACGTRQVTIEGELVAGTGVAAEMLKQAGIEVVSVP